MGSSGDKEFSRLEVREIGSSGDGELRDGEFTRWEFRKWGVHEKRRWGVYNIRSSGNGELTRWGLTEMVRSLLKLQGPNPGSLLRSKST